MKHLPEEVLIKIFEHLKEQDLKNVIISSKLFLYIVCNSLSLICKITLILDSKTIIQDELFYSLALPYKKVIVKNLANNSNKQTLLKQLFRYSESIEKIEFINSNFDSGETLNNVLQKSSKLKEVSFVNCYIKEYGSLKTFSNHHSALKFVSYHDCNENLYNIFKKHNSIEKVAVISNKKSWNAFPQEAFNALIMSLPNLKHLVFEGEGTGSYFDRSEFSYTIEKLEAERITFQWYVGITGARDKFLSSQKGNLKDLRIKHLPYDFDGGRVLKFIMEKMKLQNFYYGDIPLIVNGKKQSVKHFSAHETQILAALEMLKQFPGIESFQLIFNETDVVCEEIEKSIRHVDQNLFLSLRKFEVVDKSGYRRIFGVFMPLLQNFNNLEALYIKSQDRNINIILQECLPLMATLNTLYLNSTAPRAPERFKIIKNNAKNLKNLMVSIIFLDLVNQFLPQNINITFLEE